jgi:hypothetical protein
MNWWIIFAVAVILITADKIITVANIKAVQKNYPTLFIYYVFSMLLYWQITDIFFFDIIN